MTYKPLPPTLTIKDSVIHGLGLWAKEELEAYTSVGVCHISYVESKLIRTPLGGFINHSDTPNCIKVKVNRHGYAEWHLVPVRTIEKDKELTLSYTFYNLSGGGK